MSPDASGAWYPVPDPDAASGPPQFLKWSKVDVGYELCGVWRGRSYYLFDVFSVMPVLFPSAEPPGELQSRTPGRQQRHSVLTGIETTPTRTADSRGEEEPMTTIEDPSRKPTILLTDFEDDAPVLVVMSAEGPRAMAWGVQEIPRPEDFGEITRAMRARCWANLIAQEGPLDRARWVTRVLQDPKVVAFWRTLAEQHPERMVAIQLADGAEETP
jgi:hypothetical protein